MNHGENVQKANYKKRKPDKPVPVILSSDFGKIPPQAVDLEEDVLGVIMLARKAIEPVMNMIKDPNVFYKEAHQKIFSAIREMYLEKAPVNIKTVTQWLKKKGELEIVGGPMYISKLPNAVESIGSAEYNCGILLQKFIQRELIRIGTIAVRDAYEETADALLQMDELAKAAEGLRQITNFGVNVPYKINHMHVRKENPVVLKMNGHNVLSKGNISLWIAPPGTGKSQLVEIVLAAYLNDRSDVLGFTVTADKRVALIDTERDRDDAYDGFCRIARRVGESHIQKDGNFNNVDFLSYRTIIKWQDRRMQLRKLIETKMYNLVIIDGYGHFVGNINDPEQAEEFVGEMMSYTQVYGLGILGTMHNNFKQNSTKGQDARGHLGGALMREAQSYFSLIRDKEDKGLRMLTSKVGDNRKNRSGHDDIEVMFRWSEEHQMFVGEHSSDVVFKNPYTIETSSDKKKPRQNNDLYPTIVQMFKKQSRYTTAEFLADLMKIHGIKETAAKSRKKDAFDLEYITKDKEGYLILYDKAAHDLPF